MKKFFFVLIFSCLLLSSCIKIDVEQTVDFSGKSNVSMKVDMSQYIKQIKTLAASQSGATSPDMKDVDYCENAQENPVFETQNCYQKNENIFGMNGTLNLVKNGWMKIGEKNSYSLDVRSMVPEILSSDEETFKDNYAGSGAESPQSLGFEYTYTLELPTPTNFISLDGKEIEVQNGNARFSFGKIENNVLTFDIFEMLASKSFTVYGGESRASLSILSEGISSYVFEQLTTKQQSRVLTVLENIQDRKNILKLEDTIRKNISLLKSKENLTIKEKKKLGVLLDVEELVRVSLQ